ncbi:MAG: MATE family efflux transporter [Pseudomonadota bacterium]
MMKTFWQGSGRLCRLAVPIVAAQLAYALLSFIDIVSLGLISPTALAGGALASAILAFFYLVSSMMVSVVGNEVAYARGAGDEAGITAAVQAGIVLSSIMGVVGTTIVWSSPFWLGFFGQEPSIVDAAREYLRGAAAGLFFGLFFACHRSVLASLGRPTAITVVIAAVGIIKIIVNTWIVRSVADFGEPLLWGLRLVGLSAVGGYILLSAALWFYGRYVFPQHMAFRKLAWARWDQMKKTLRLGMPIGVATALEVGLFTSSTLVVGRLGEVALAAHQLALQCIFMSFTLVLGLSQAVAIEVGLAAGGWHGRAARRAAHQGLAIGFIFMSVMIVVFALYGTDMAGLLIRDEGAQASAVILLAGQLILIAACFQWVDGIQVIALGALRGLKITKPAMVATLVGYWAIGFPSMIGLSLLFGAYGVWWGLVLGLTVAAVMLVVRFEQAVRQLPQT